MGGQQRDQRTGEPARLPGQQLQPRSCGEGPPDGVETSHSMAGAKDRHAATLPTCPLAGAASPPLSHMLPRILLQRTASHTQGMLKR